MSILITLESFKSKY